MEEVLRAAFALGGSDVGAIEIMRNRATGLPRGFAFVKLLARFDVSIDTDALDRLASTTMEGRPLDVQGVVLATSRIREKLAGSGVSHAALRYS